MRAGIGNAVHRVVEGKILVVVSITGIKSKLQDLHARITCILEQLTDRIRQESQIFRNDLSFRHFFLDLVKEVHARAFLPFAILRSGRSIRNCVIGVEATEVIDPDDVIQLCQILNPSQPPVIPGVFVIVPVIQRVAPQLSIGAESIRRTAGHSDRLPVFIQLEELGMAPGIHRVQGDINRQVADDVDSFSIRVVPEFLPLLEEQILNRFIEVNILAVLLRQTGHGLSAVVPFVIFPLQPGLAAIFVLQSHEQSIVRKPVIVFFQKFVILIRLVLQKPGCSLPQDFGPVVVQSTIVHMFRIASPVHGFVFSLFQESVFGQQVQVNEIRIARKCGKRSIRRISVAGGNNRKQLPD